jgi:hypothetical protein
VFFEKKDAETAVFRPKSGIFKHEKRCQDINKAPFFDKFKLLIMKLLGNPSLRRVVSMPQN